MYDFVLSLHSVSSVDMSWDNEDKTLSIEVWWLQLKFQLTVILFQASMALIRNLTAELKHSHPTISAIWEYVLTAGGRCPAPCGPGCSHPPCRGTSGRRWTCQPWYQPLLLWGNIKIIKFDVMKKVIELEMNSRKVWSFTIREKSTNSAFSLLKEANTAFKNLWRHLCWRRDHNGWVGWLA